jgi:hypothetical protein
MEYLKAPWNLKGKGYILLYRFNQNFIKDNVKLPEFLKGRFCGGFGAVMLVDYNSSNAGPYSELLFIPGKFQHNQIKLNTISHIYVSTMESVVNGRRNWGIPKEQAQFSFKTLEQGSEQIQIMIGDHKIAEFTIRARKLKFPVSTRFLPFPLVQKFKERLFYTKFFGSGTGHLAKLEKISINSEYFPDFSGCKPIAVIKVDPFSITFPKARIRSLSKK